MININTILTQVDPININEVSIGSLSANYDDTAAITSISVTATQIDLKDGDKIMVQGNALEINADAAAGATSLTIVSITLSAPIIIGDEIRINEDNLFVQYQRKTEGTIAGMPVSATDLGPINYAGGDYTIDADVINGVDMDYMKILPRDFMVNDDVGSATETPPAVFNDGTNTGVSVEDTSQELIATVNIPYDRNAYEVYVWASNTSKTVDIYEMNINANGTGSAVGSGTTNGSAIAIDVDASATNYLMIKVSVSSTNHRVWGGAVLLAAKS